MAVLSIDFETRSPVDLPAVGVYRYAEDPDTDIWCMAWAFDDEEPAVWLPPRMRVVRDESGTFGGWENPNPSGLPLRVLDHIQAGGEIRAWNAQFERLMWQQVMVPRYGAPPVALAQWVCSAAEAAAMALPRSLGHCAEALGVAQQKDKQGAKLMLALAQPKTRTPRADGTMRYTWHDDPEKLAALFAYCQQDVRTERALVPRLRRLTPTERQVYLLDQTMNDRGIAVDLPLVDAAEAIALEGIARADAVLQEATAGAVTRVTQRPALLRWLQSQGHAVDSTDKATVKALLDGDLHPDVRRALIAVADAGRSSVKKLQVMRAAANRDGRVRGLLLYHGASTGRWAGRVVQPQNFPRGEVDDIAAWIPLVQAGDYEAIALAEPPVKVVASMLRAMLTAAPGHLLLAADYSAIEARVVNWLAGQEDILDLFRRGEDVYKHNAARLYGIPLAEVQKFPHRQTGKFQELGCGFGMGWKKAVDAAKAVYGLDLTPEMARDIVTGYRETHARVKAFWYETEDACKAAVTRPGEAIRFGDQGRLTAVKMGGYLLIRLPSGRALSYPAPRIVEAETPWSREAREAAEEARALASLLGEPLPPLPEPELRPSLEFSAPNNQTRVWERERTYGGKLVENIVQAVARDLMAEGMLRAEARGFRPILSVHDEVIAEVLDYHGGGPLLADRVREFEQCLTELPAWAEGLPVAAEGWIGFRYRK